MSATLPPIGSITTDPCSPCATPPTDCGAALSALQVQVCSLATNYLDVIAKYGQMLSKLQGGILSVNDLASELQQLQQQINDLQGANCSKLGAATTADAILVCSGGIEKTFAAPSNSGSGIVSFKDGNGNWKWQVGSPGMTFHSMPVVWINASYSSSAAFNETLPSYPADVTGPVWVHFTLVFGTTVANPTADRGEATLEANGLGIGQLGGFGGGNYIVFGKFEATSANVAFTWAWSPNIVGTSVSMSILGYEY